MDRRKTERLHVVPKADVDRMFEELKHHIPANSELARKLRGMVYTNTFLTARTIIIITEDSDDSRRPYYPFG
jgi:hypothetical protein